MVEALVIMHRKKRAQGAPLGIRGPKDATINPRELHESGTHEAGLKGHVDGTARQPPAAKCPRRLDKRPEFRVSGGVGVDLSAVVTPRNDVPIADDHRPNWHLADSPRNMRLLNGKPHERDVRRIITP
jgi:hypothetical protein